MNKKLSTGQSVRRKDQLNQIHIFLALLSLLAFACHTNGQQQSSSQTNTEETTVALMFAARDNNCEVIRKLIEAGADVNGRNPQSATPLMWASSAGSVDAVRCLLAAGAAVNARTLEGKTALSLTIEYFNHNHNESNENDFVRVVSQLITSGANVRASEKSGLTPLLWAAAAGNRLFAAQLIDAGADVNLKSLVKIHPHHYLRVTPLIFAIINSTDEKTGTLAVVKLLIERGADVSARDNKGRTALDWAKQINDDDLVRALTRH
jgi:ankyrin repeat protein